MNKPILEKVFISLEADLIPIPQEDNSDWLQWCKDHDVYPLNGPRRGWHDSSKSYIGDSLYLVFVPEFGIEFFISNEDLHIVN